MNSPKPDRSPSLPRRSAPTVKQKIQLRKIVLYRAGPLSPPGLPDIGAVDWRNGSNRERVVVFEHGRRSHGLLSASQQLRLVMDCYRLAAIREPHPWNLRRRRSQREIEAHMITCPLQGSSSPVCQPALAAERSRSRVITIKATTKCASSRSLRRRDDLLLISA